MSNLKLKNKIEDSKVFVRQNGKLAYKYGVYKAPVKVQKYGVPDQVLKLEYISAILNPGRATKNQSNKESIINLSQVKQVYEPSILAGEGYISNFEEI